MKSIVIGVIISSIILLLIPDLRKGSGLPLTLFSPKESLQKKLSYNQAVNAAGPAVVNIYSQSIDNVSRYSRRQPVKRTSLGSGVIMTADGYILTCYHVIANAANAEANSILVGLQDGRFYEAQIRGFDAESDLAVLRVSAENLQPIPQLSTPNTLVGDVVLAIGNPYNLGQTVTQGVVSRIDSNQLANYFDYIQTDAVLSEGNSGGALVDSEGHLVGITNANFKTRIRNRVAAVDGVSFAVPYPLAKKVMEEIIATGKVTRGALKFVGQEYPNGILVNAVAKGGPAEEGGLQVNDIILSVNNIPTEGVRKTLEFISDTPPGTELLFEVNRGGNKLMLKMTVAEL